jgi:hypothetical protein
MRLALASFWFALTITMIVVQDVKPPQAPAPQAAPVPVPPAAPKVYKPTEVQGLKLQVAKDQVDMVKMQYQNAMGQLNSTVEAVRKEEGWPDTVLFNMDSMTFVEGPPKAAAVPPTTPAPAKPVEAPKPAPKPKS